MRFEIIHVLVDWWTWINLILDPIQSGHQHGGEGIVRVAGRVWEANFDPLGLWIRGLNRNPNASTAVPTGISQVDGCLEAGRQPLVRVRRRIGDRRQGQRMLEDSADVPEAELGGPGIFFAGKERLPFLPDALMGVHAGAVVLE